VTDPLEPLAVDYAIEIARKTAESPMELVLQPLTVLMLAGALQLANRHPDFPRSHRAIVDRFLMGAREYFADCPTVLEVLRRGDDPQFDR
jgi:hypothetical protein